MQYNELYVSVLRCFRSTVFQTASSSNFGNLGLRLIYRQVAQGWQKMRSDRAKSQKMKKQAPPITERALESLNRQEIRPTPELGRALAVKRAMLELTTDAVLVTDEVQVTDFNEEYVNMWGYLERFWKMASQTRFGNS